MNDWVLWDIIEWIRVSCQRPNMKTLISHGRIDTGVASLRLKSFRVYCEDVEGSHPSLCSAASLATPKGHQR